MSRTEVYTVNIWAACRTACAPWKELLSCCQLAVAAFTSAAHSSLAARLHPHRTEDASVPRDGLSIATISSHCWLTVSLPRAEVEQLVGYVVFCWNGSAAAAPPSADPGSVAQQQA